MKFNDEVSGIYAVMKKSRRRWFILIAGWHQTALEEIFQTGSRVLCFWKHRKIMDLSEDSLSVPDIVILDASPRNSVGLILKLRQTWPVVYIIFTRKTFLFSDKAVAEFFGGVWLKEYDAIMVGVPENSLPHCLISSTLSGTYALVKIMNSQVSEDEIMSELNGFLYDRLSQIISVRATDVIFKWLLSNMSVSEISRQSGLKEKTVYHYRERVMRLLQICHYSKDLTASLTVSLGNEDKMSLNQKISLPEITGELIRGQVDIRFFHLLMTVSQIRNPHMQQALEDVFVCGLSRQVACEKHAVSQSYFSQKYRHIQNVSHTVTHMCQLLNDKKSP